MRFAQRVFLFAGIYGMLLMPPMYFAEQQIGKERLQDLNHPEFYYGFVGVVLAFQVAFLIIAYDPRRFRPMMIPAMLEKFLFVFAVIGLYLAGRGREVAGLIPFGAMMDVVFGSLFIASFIKTREVD
jgi:hypothetical protein